MIEVTFQGAPAGAGQLVFRFWRPALKRLGTMNVTGIFQLARMHAQISIRCLDRLLELVESKRFLGGEGANNSQTQALMNHAIDFVRTMRRAAMHAFEFLFIRLMLW